MQLFVIIFTSVPAKRIETLLLFVCHCVARYIRTAAFSLTLSLNQIIYCFAGVDKILSNEIGNIHFVFSRQPNYSDKSEGLLISPRERAKTRKRSASTLDYELNESRLLLKVTLISLCLEFVYPPRR